ncbi:hypothetical protein IWX90DRAFT_197163 [Phyllosticta citrichinensis]|uniref:RNase MRP protein 1 RNA binding domain-containing protein n=1 Tax=Phyllosticta citrichinensis TaxID=1130410 RepID=A0ABR1XXN1_9PEZI
MAPPSKTTSTGPPRLKPNEISEFKTFNDIMHLLHHRNLNQHRQSIWWRSFSTFRREMLHLVAEHEAISSSKTAAKKTSKRVVARVDHWKNNMVPKWYLAFTNVVASNQFSAIGLALMAILARVSHCLGITAAYEAEAEREMQTVLEEFAKKDAHTLFGPQNATDKAEDFGEVISRRDDGTEVADDDFGQVVSRQEIEGGADMEPAAEPESMQRTKPKAQDRSLDMKRVTSQAVEPDTEPQPLPRAKSKTKSRRQDREAEDEVEPELKEPLKKKKKMKKSKGGSIDDLFAGL